MSQIRTSPFVFELSIFINFYISVKFGKVDQSISEKRDDREMNTC